MDLLMRAVSLNPPNLCFNFSCLHYSICVKRALCPEQISSNPPQVQRVQRILEDILLASVQLAFSRPLGLFAKVANFMKQTTCIVSDIHSYRRLERASTLLVLAFRRLLLTSQSLGTMLAR